MTRLACQHGFLELESSTPSLSQNISLSSKKYQTALEKSINLKLNLIFLTASGLSHDLTIFHVAVVKKQNR